MSNWLITTITVLALVLAGLAVPDANANKDIQDFGEAGSYVAGVGAGAAGVEAIVVGPGTASAVAGGIASGVTWGLASLTWLVGKACGGTLPLHQCPLNPTMLSGVSLVDPTTIFTPTVPDAAALLSAAHLSAAQEQAFINSPLGVPTTNYWTTSSEFLGATIGWIGTALNMAVANQIGRQDLLVTQGQFLQDYATEIEMQADDFMAASVAFGTAFTMFHEAEGIFVTPMLVTDEITRLSVSGFTQLELEVLGLFGFDNTAIAVIRDANLEVFSAADPAFVATLNFASLAEVVPSFVDGVKEDTAQTLRAIVPEPSTYILLVTGLLGLLGYAWRLKR